jgi:hypothetical protein
MSNDLTQTEMLAIAQVIDGTIDSMMQDVNWDHEDVNFWMTILRKLGGPAEKILNSWVETAAEEGYQI